MIIRCMYIGLYQKVMTKSIAIVDNLIVAYYYQQIIGKIELAVANCLPTIFHGNKIVNGLALGL